MKKKLILPVMACFTASTILAGCGVTEEVSTIGTVEALTEKTAESAEEITNEGKETADPAEEKADAVSSDDPEYQTAYDYASENALAILEYYVAYVEHGNLLPYEDLGFESYQQLKNYSPSVFYEEESVFEATIDDFDPSVLSLVVENHDDSSYTAPLDYEIYTGNVGTNSYFIGADVVDQFLSLDQDAYLAIVGLTNEVRADACCVYGVYEDYAIASSTDPIIDIINQMRIFSGYTAATRGVYRIIDLIETNNDLTEDSGGNESLNGRIDALNDYIDKWVDAREQWEAEFLADYDLTWEDLISPETLVEEDMTAEEYIDSANSKAIASSHSYNYGDYTSLDFLDLYIYQLVDKDSNVLCSYVTELANDVKVGYDGKWELIYKDNIIVLDKEGNILLDTDKTEYVLDVDHGIWVVSMTSSEFTGMTPSGNYLICSEDSDYEQGEYKILEWLSSDGSTKEIMQAENFIIQPVPENRIQDCYVFNGGYSTVSRGWDYCDTWSIATDIYIADPVAYVDMETGELIENYTEESESVPNGYVQISPDYYMDENSYYVYDSADLTNPIAELTDGEGVESLIYDRENDVYWVMSKTWYYYKLDGDFTYLSEPVKIPDEAVYYQLTPYGLLISEDISHRSYLFLLDENGNEISRHLWKAGMYGNIVFTVGFFEKCCDYYFNLNNSELLCITKPDSSNGDNSTIKEDRTEEDEAAAEQDEVAANEEGEDASEESRQDAETSNTSFEDAIEATGGGSQVDATEVPLNQRIFVSSNVGEWFSFTIDEPAEIKISTVRIAGRAPDYFYLYDAEGAKIQQFVPGGDGKIVTEWVELDAGTYYIYHAPYTGGINTDAMFWVTTVEE